MKKVMAFVLPLKAMAAMIFAGFICLYMISGVIYNFFTENEFYFSIPYTFILQGLGLSVLISILWELFFGNVLIKTCRFFLRHLMFELSLLTLFAICFLKIISIPTEWAKLWLIAAAIITAGIIIISGICEIYFKKAGKRYTEILRSYKSSI